MVYALIKLLHIVAVVLWLGGGVLLILKAIRAERSDNVTELAAIIEDTVYFTYRLFIPAAVVALICGLAMVWLVWGVSLAWVWIGLIGYAAVVLSGTVLLKPRADRCVEFIRAGDSSGLRASGREILRIANFNYIILFVIAGDMVLKPSLSDAMTLIIMAVIVVGAGLSFLHH
jgi:uncharacterized membrane protein